MDCPIVLEIASLLWLRYFFGFVLFALINLICAGVMKPSMPSDEVVMKLALTGK